MKINELAADFDKAEFLANYWQKKPVLIRQLVPGFVDPLTPEELAGCALEDQVESRLITEFEPDRFELRNGPFVESDFTSLPTSHYTLLVQAMDQWFDEVAELRRRFDFVPSWRVDDVMISYACEGGGVGPHFDNYDVFLLQGQGQRRWRIGQHCDADTPLREGAPLRLLEAFDTAEDFILNAGDALYVPPKVAHWGVSLDESLCYSIGFRAPSEGEMIEGFSDFLIRSDSGDTRYTDPRPAVPTDVNELLGASLDPSFEALRAKLDNPSLFRRWFGCHVTQPKYPELIEPLDAASVQIIEAAMEDASSLSHHPASRFVFMREPNEAWLFVDGNAVAFASNLGESLSRLCNSTPLRDEELDLFLKKPEMRELLLELLKQGSLQID